MSAIKELRSLRDAPNRGSLFWDMRVVEAAKKYGHRNVDAVIGLSERGSVENSRKKLAKRGLL